MTPLRAFCLGLLALSLAGCAGYRLGPTNNLAAGDKSISLRPVRNQTMEPRLSDPVATSLRRSLQQDGTYRLNTSGDADVEVETVIVAYDREELSYQPSDIITVRDYRIRMRAKVVAKERISGKVLLDQLVSGRTTLRVGNDLPSAERQAMPLLAEDLAKNITALLVEGGW